MYKIAISRPILTLVFGLLLIFFGVLALFRFPIALFPDIDFPVVSITTNYPGANAETIETKVTDKIEEAVSGIDGIDQVTSTSSQNVSRVIVKFKLDKPKEEAVSDVRDKVSAVRFDDAKIKNPVIQQFDSNSKPIIAIFVSVANENVSAPQLMTFAKYSVEPILGRISGVAGTNTTGYRARAIRVQPHSTLMNKYNITYTQLANIIAQENVEIDSGKIRTKDKEWVITTDANAKNIEELGNIRISNNLKLSDIATITDSTNEDSTYSALSTSGNPTLIKGKMGVLFEVQKIAGQNDVAIAQSVRDTLPQIEALSSDFNVEIIYDTTEYIKHSIKEVKFDLVLGAILATLIVFLFLRSFTMTIVAAISLPISILGTLAFIQAMGQSLNMLTMLALTLAIGIIIDDAIVVIENIHKKLESGMDRLEAAYEGVREIGFAIIAISAMLLAVFVPIASMGEMIGRILQAFGLAVVAAIIISYFVVVTIIPMISSLVVSTQVSRFYTITEPFFRKLDRIYVKLVQFTIHYKFSTLFAVIVFFVLSVFLVSKLGFNFLVAEDKSEFNINIESSPGITMEAMKEKLTIAQDLIMQDEAVKLANMRVGGGSLLNAFRGRIYVALVPQEMRKGRDQFKIMAELRDKLRKALPGMKISASEISSLGGGSTAPLQVVILGQNQDNVDKTTDNLVAMLEKIDGVTDIRLDTPDFAPQYKIHILRQNANRNNVSSQAIGSAINAAFSGETKVAYYRENAKEYEILLRVPDNDRKKIEDLRYLQIPNANGEMVFIDGLIKIEETKLPATIKRYNRGRSITLYANIDQKKTTLNDVLIQMEDTKSQWLLNNVSYNLDGEAKQAKIALIQIGIAIAMAFILIYLILAALYESLVQPIIIMITLPLSFSGAFIALYLTGNKLSLFGMIGLMVLMGVVGKNATLIVDMANDFRLKGKSINEAIILAGESRLRPILMTVFAMVFGMIPLALSSGAGSSMKYPIGLSMIGGLIVSMFLSLLVVPAFYKIMSPLDEWSRKFYAKNLKFK